MIVTFIVIGVVGLLMLALSLVVGEVFDLGDGALSGTSIGVGAVVFGAVGSITAVNGWPTLWAYVGSAVVGLLAVVAVQLMIRRLRATEDGQPVSLIGVTGVVTATITPTGIGEVSLDAAHELERRLAHAAETIPAGTRVVVVEQLGSRVTVARVSASPAQE